MYQFVPVFFVREMVAKPSATFSPSAEKPAKVVADWRDTPDIASAIELVEFDSISRDTIALAHDAQYVSDVLNRRADNGFRERSASIANSLPYTTGSMLHAAQHVLDEPNEWAARCRIACSPSSGFHHAHYDHCYGYCTFNGLMITALELKRLDLIDSVLILDCDEHYGDGTQDIIERLDINWITHITHGGKLPGSYGDKATMINLINEHVPSFSGPRRLVLYQAGADCHVDDPLGGFLTTEDMIERDRLVFSLAAQHRVPLVWNLAGGYQRDLRNRIEPVLLLHRNTMYECIRALTPAEASITGG